MSGPKFARQPGREVAALVSVVDIFATIAECAGADLSQLIPEGTVVDSLSLVPYITNPQQSPLRNTIYTERANLDGSWVAAVRNNRYKLIRLVNRPGVEEFYDLWNDPLEVFNLLENLELTKEEQVSYGSLDQAMNELQESEPG